MSEILRPRIIPIEEQHGIVREITTFERYEEFHRSQFYKENWLNVLKNTGIPEGMNESLKADYFRLIGLVGIVSAQFGWYSVDGQIFRNKKHGWSEPASPQHQFALACYTSSLNVETYDFKEAVAREIGAVAPNDDVGIWGIPLEVADGKVKKFSPGRIRYIAGESCGRMGDIKNVLLPDKNLNTKLHRVGFTGDDAERMRRDYIAHIEPRAQEAVGELIDDIGTLLRVGL